MEKGVILLLVLAILTGGCATGREAPPTAVPEHPDGEVVVYVRAGCPYCAKALDLLRSEGVVPLLRDVARDREALGALRAIYLQEFPEEKVIVPLTAFQGRYFRGYHPQGMLDFIAALPPNLKEYPQYCQDPEGGGTETGAPAQ